MDRQELLASLAASYDRSASEREAAGEPAWRDDIRADFASRLPTGGRILEVGAGVGYTAKWFLDQGFDTTATDLSAANVEMCRQKGLNAEVRDMADLGFDRQSFDGVWAASCLMHIADAGLPSVLEEIGRVLAAGGHFWAGTWGGPDQEGTWEDDRYEPKRFYSIRNDERMRAFYETRFTVLSYSTFDPRPDLDWHYQSALLLKQ
jgi:SAM-dependent methyltransferase